MFTSSECPMMKSTFGYDVEVLKGKVSKTINLLVSPVFIAYNLKISNIYFGTGHNYGF